VVIHNHYDKTDTFQTKSFEKLAIPDELKVNLQKLIQNGRPEQALDKLATFSQEHSGKLSPEVVALSDRWQDMSYKIRMGLISHENAVLTRNQIVGALIEVIA
jgi:Effector-associated domain 11